MKYWTLLVAGFLLAGCTKVDSSEGDEDTVLVDDNLSDFNMSTAEGFGGINEDFFLEIEREPGIEIASEILLSAERREGVVDIEAPDYHILAVQKNGVERELYAWWDETDPEELLLMNSKDTNTVFTVDESSALQFEKLFKY
ncbi:hypothetical protein [Marinilactibacillus kalidii]|uniref:hypothetical protein n=1 Tax=Marinilactibacillus kalidii TaxID=2820274 RepID=UPI001ABE17FE|nr:hypothetical protein [Marinilactibacillus kalidii]